jgi:catechol 1,2-dioxygenase
MTSERARSVLDALVEAVREVIKTEKVQYTEFHAAVGFLNRVGASGEIPLLLAVLLEATVDEVTHAAHEGSTTTIQGPFYIPGAPLLDPPYTLPQRSDELGETLIMSGTVKTPGGEPLANAELDMWQATATVPGQYSNVHPGIPDFNLRGRLRTDAQGCFEVRTVVPAPYEIPKTGPTGELFDLIGRSAWRPSHVHFKVSHPGYRTLTTQLFFTGGDYLDTDAGNAVKPDLIIPLATSQDGADGPDSQPTRRANYDFVLEPHAG